MSLEDDLIDIFTGPEIDAEEAATQIAEAIDDAIGFVFGDSGTLYFDKTLTADGTGGNGAIVGSGTGAVGDADGVTLVAAQANKIIVPLWMVGVYTRLTASYGGGGNMGGYCAGLPVTAVLGASSTFAAANSRQFFLGPASSGLITVGSFINSPLYLFSTSPFTNVAGATGFGRFYGAYVLMPA